MINKNINHNLGSMRVIYNQKDADPRTELENIGDDKGVNELILHDIEKRLKKGSKKYGSQITLGDKRNWLREAYEEILDALVYMTIALFKLLRNGKKN